MSFKLKSSPAKMFHQGTSSPAKYPDAPEGTTKTPTADHAPVPAPPGTGGKKAPAAPPEKKKAYVKKGGKSTGKMSDYALNSQERADEYTARGWAQDSTTKVTKKKEVAKKKKVVETRPPDTGTTTLPPKIDVPKAKVDKGPSDKAKQALEKDITKDSGSGAGLNNDVVKTKGATTKAKTTTPKAKSSKKDDRKFEKQVTKGANQAVAREKKLARKAKRKDRIEKVKAGVKAWAKGKNKK